MYEFKIGDVGKTRYGTDYRVVALLGDGDVSSGERVVAVTDGRLLSYQEDGRYYDSREHGYDLLPPKGRTVYLNVYPDGDHWGYNTEQEARDNATVSAQLIAFPIELPPGI